MHNIRHSELKHAKHYTIRRICLTMNQQGPSSILATKIATTHSAVYPSFQIVQYMSKSVPEKLRKVNSDNPYITPDVCQNSVLLPTPDSSSKKTDTNVLHMLSLTP